METPSFKEQRIRKITILYYSRKDIQDAIFEFSKNREVCPRYFEGFGTRPDILQYKGDILELAKKGATSFHCSEELWQNPLNIEIGMAEKQLNDLRIGWDLLIDIDSKYIDYSKISAELIINLLKFHGVKNIGIKFSGSKGFHLILPWKSFPKIINGIKTSDMFPEYPRIITRYITEKIKNQLIDKITELSKPSNFARAPHNQDERDWEQNKYVKDFQAPKEVMPDIILVSPRHLFRMPYSLHEKTALASVVLKPEEISNFQLSDAEPMKVKIKNFLPDSEEGEAKELLTQALDWDKENKIKKGDSQEKIEGKFANFKPIELKNLTEENFSPCLKLILQGLSDGKKRALFVLINLFRSVGMNKVELEKKIYDWNNKNKPPLKRGYISSQLFWAYRKKPIMPPNCKEFYQGIGVCAPDNFCKMIKNPTNYVIRKNLMVNRKGKKN